MPIYEYYCPDCDRHVDVEHSMNETKLPACPQCYKEMRRVFTSPNIDYKGQGWTNAQGGR